MFEQSYTQGGRNYTVSVMQKDDQQRVMIRKAVSDLSSWEMERNKEKEEEKEEEEVDEAECRCCGLKEECTKHYILEIQTSFSGNWVCGLCSEAVKERLLKFPNTTIHKAVDFHRDFCHSFNSTTRLNPKLSLTSSMRKIARKSFENRSSSGNNNLSRSVSCDPRIGGLQD